MTDVAEIEVVCPGMLVEVLSVGKGDLKIVVGDDPEDRENARRMIEGMLRAGYSIFVETDKGLRRVKKFNPNRMTYHVAEIVEDTTPAPAPAAKQAAKPRGRVVEREVPVAGSRAKAIGRTAGG